MKFAKKSLGQNFLVDKNIIRKIINSVKIENRHVIEIGPGHGALTNEILKLKPKSLSVIEKDFELFSELQLKYKHNKKINVFNNDILKFDLRKVLKNKLIIFGNLPYNISSQILIKIIKLKKFDSMIDDMIFMFQKELGEKIICRFPSKQYGRLSIISNYKLSIKDMFLVSPNCFYPKPKVNSMVIHFQPKKKKLFAIKDISNLEKITNILFSNKRKMINKNIKKILSENKIKDIQDLKISLRPSDIKPEVYYKITELYEKK